MKDVDLVDRCESCHLGTREPVSITKASMGGEAGLQQPSEQGTAEDPRSGKVRLHAVPRRQRGGAGERGEGARVQQILVVAAAPQREYRCGLPAVPLPRKSSRRWPTRSTRGARSSGCAAAWRAIATRASTARRTRSPASTSRFAQLEQQKAEWKREAGFAEQKANNPRTSDDEAKKLLAHSNDLKVRASGLDATDRAARHALAQPGARGEEGRPQPEGSARQTEKGMDSGMAEGSAPMA